MSAQKPPRVVLSWSATALGTDFGGYRIYRRPPRLGAPWELLFDITVPDGLTAANVEAQFVKAVDYEAGWAGLAGQWAGGWDYAVTVINATTGVESFKTSIDLANVVDSDASPWITCNSAPYLNFVLEQMSQAKAQDDQVVKSYIAAGRDELVTRTPSELPGRRYQLAWDEFTMIGEDQLRMWRAAAAAGRQCALLLPLGDRILGTPVPPGIGHTQDLLVSATGDFYETGRASVVTGRNVSGGIVLAGNTIVVPTNTLLNPGGSAFTVVIAAAFGNFGAARCALSKGGITDGYAIRSTNTGNQLQFFVNDGLSASGGPVEDNAIWYDGDVHVAIGTTDGATQALYRDGTLVNTTSVVHGDISSSYDFAIGGANGGVSAVMGLTPVRAWALYPRKLNATDAAAVTAYLLGYAGSRMPAGPVIFMDLRDDRCWAGVETAAPIADLSGFSLDANADSRTVFAQPWPLSTIDRFG